jgi:hypothetical protein
MEDFVLKFEGPFGLIKNVKPHLFEHPIAKVSGLYLWTVPYHHGGYLVTYVGETGFAIGRRIKEHLIQTVGGNYRITDPALSIKGESKILWNGLWRRGTREKLPNYIDHLEEFAPIIRKTLQTEVIFIAPLQSDRRLRQRIEGAIAQHIKIQPLPASSLLPLDIRYNPRKKEEVPISVIIECASSIHGLPEALYV